ncbi:MAG: hypothetical protein NTW14_12035 [bacterium]|nr:hypothetical protein [bacterium]
MDYKRLFIWVEGDDDERFIERILTPICMKSYDHVHVQKYAQMKTEKKIEFLQSIEDMGADYIFLADINHHPCKSSKKDSIIAKLNLVKPESIYLVILEIESWYLAGIEAAILKRFKIKPFKDSDSLTKEQFEELIPKTESRINFMNEILNSFVFDVARQKNKSFDYFCRNFLETLK